MTEYNDGPFAFIIPKDLGVSNAWGLDGATVALITGGDLELAVARYFSAAGVTYEPVPAISDKEVSQLVFTRADVLVVPASGVDAGSLDSDWMLLPEIIDDSGAVVLSGTAGSDRVIGTGLDDDLDGFDGKDFLKGLGGSDDLSGGRGRDKLSGGRGADELKGQQGNDWLVGGKGNDLLKGGGGRDTFVFSGNDRKSRDVIVDFRDGFDTIRIKGLEFSDLSFSQKGTSNARIVLDEGGEIVLRNFEVSNLGLDDFVFV